MTTTPRILVVDDDSASLALVASIVSRIGCEALTASYGEDALRLARSKDPDVVLCDLCMPGIDGVGVVSALKADTATRGIPIVMITGNDNSDERVRAYEAGVDDFLTKPVEEGALQSRVRSLVKAKAHHDHLVEYGHRMEAEVGACARDLAGAMDRLRSSWLDTLHRLSHAVEYRDRATASHTSRVGRYAGVLARACGLPPQRVAEIEAAAPMHDIGKIGIPDALLFKATSLTAEERVIMERHTEIGASILKGAEAPVIRLAEVIALTHHERWDGQGYPGRLCGKAIPLEGRITAVADVFDALCSPRVYRPAGPLDPVRAFEVIVAGRGTRFDPAVVDAAVSHREVLLALAADLPEPLHLVPVVDAAETPRASGPADADIGWLADLGHALKSPLTGAIGLAATLGEGLHGALSDAQRLCLGMVEESNRRTLTLVNDMLALARIQCGRDPVARGAFAPEPSYRAACEAVRPAASAKAVRFGSEAAPLPAVVYGDDLAIRHIWSCLLRYAVRTSPAGSSVGCALRWDERRPGLVLTVSDRNAVDPSASLRDKAPSVEQLIAVRNQRHDETALWLHLAEAGVRRLGGTLAVEMEAAGARVEARIPCSRT